MSFDFTVKEFILGGGTGTPTFQFYRRGFNLGSSGSGPEWRDIILHGNTALTLVNAKADGLNYLKLFGGTEQRNLPVGYTEYDGLIGDGTAYINLDCTIDQDDEIEIELSISSATTSRNLFGYRSSASSNNISALFGSAGTLVADFNNSDYTTYRLNETVNTDTRYKLVINKTGRYLYQVDNGSLVGSNTNACADTISCLSTYLFNTAGSPGATAKFNGTIHRCLIKGKRDVVPAGNGTTYGVYDKLNDVFYPNANTEGSFTVGNTTVPSPDTPMNIISNNGAIKCSPNLVNMVADNVDLGHYISATGVYSESVSNFLYVPYIKVQPNTTYTLSFSDELYYITISEYSANDGTGFIQRNAGTIGGNTSLTVTTQATTQYIRFGSNPYGNSNTVTMEQVLTINWMLAKADTPQPYMPYGQIYVDGTTETVNVHGKNLFDITDDSPNKFWSAQGQETESIAGGVYFVYSGFIPCQPNTSYTISGKRITGGTSYVYSCAFFDKNKQFIERQSGSPSVVQNENYVKTFVSPVNASYISFNHFANDENVQVELGTTATTYEPYYNGGQATAERLLKVGTYQDIQSVLDGEVTRNVGVKVLDGTETWIEYGSSIPGLVYSDVAITNNLINAPITSMICSHLQIDKTNTVEEGKIRFQGNITTNKVASGRIYIKADASWTLAQTTQWLTDQYNAGNPVVVLYPLATATTETVTAQPLTIQAGSNVVEITQASIDNLELEVSYKGKEGE